MLNIWDIDTDIIGAILVDIDDTLYDYQSAHEIALAETYNLFTQQFPCEMSQQEYSSLYRELRTDVTKRLKGQGSARSRLLAFQALFERLLDPPVYLWAKQFSDLYWETLIGNMTPNEELISWLRACSQKGIRVCALTDMQAGIQIEKLSRLGLTEVITYLVSSEEVGCEKPDANMFTAALSKVGVAAKNTVMIGDSDIKDIQGAAMVGIRACQITKYL